AQTMLPILRVLPVGGVLLAIFILVLALSPPDGSRAPLNTTMAPARGPLVDAGHNPETRQFLIRAALKRADELNRLRELPDTPTRTAPAPAEPVAIEPAPAETAVEEPKVAGLPADRIESDPEPEEPAATETPNVSIPVETSEVSAPDLPVAPQQTNSTEGKPEQAKEPTKEQAKPQPRDTRRRVAHRPRRARAVSAPQRPLNLFEALFGGQQYRYPQSPGTQQAAQRQSQQLGYSAQSAQDQYQPPAYDYQLQAPTEPYPMLRQHSY
ncbi:MAG: hypothetical protein WAJ88_06590, partial [Pseudolabrys sp.]